MTAETLSYIIKQKRNRRISFKNRIKEKNILRKETAKIRLIKCPEECPRQE